jgi:hypothetical protein
VIRQGNALAKIGAILVVTMALAWSGRHLHAEPISEEEIHIEFDRGRLAVAVGEVALERILDAIAREAGLRLKTRGDLGSARAQAFEGLPLSEGIKRVVGDSRVNLIMFYEPTLGGRKRRLIEVRAYERALMNRPRVERGPPSPLPTLPRAPPPPPPPAVD